MSSKNEEVELKFQNLSVRTIEKQLSLFDVFAFNGKFMGNRKDINNMFNFDSLSGGNFYAGQYCSYGYFPYYHADSLPSLNSNEPLFQSYESFAPKTPAYAPLDPEELKCPTVPTKDSEDRDDPQEEEEKMPWIPAKAEEESKPTSVKLQQKYGRNIASNIFHSIVRWALVEPSFEKVIESAIRRNGLKITLWQFKQKLRQKTGHLKGYVNGKTMRGLYLGRRIGATRMDLESSKILRILSRVYLKNYHVNHVYCSAKIKKKSRQLHLQKVKALMQLIN